MQVREYLPQRILSGDISKLSRQVSSQWLPDPTAHTTEKKLRALIEKIVLLVIAWV
jgi:hypothetical protein